MSQLTQRPFAALAASALCLAGVAGAHAQQDESVSTTLAMQPTKLDFQGSREAGMMYMPSSVELTTNRPDMVKKEPSYRATPRYAVVSLGSGPNSKYAIALDEPTEGDAKIYLDLNGNGDLTDDNDGKWTSKTERPDAAPSYQGTWVFDVSWKLADGKVTKGKYGLNFYYSPDRGRLNYYRAGALTGTLNVQGKSYEVLLLENDNDARFNKLFKPDAVVFAGDPMTKPVWLTLDGTQHDIRGTFGFAGMNWEAHVTDDGTHLTMKPTFRVIKIPQPVEAPKILGAGNVAPDFEMILKTDDGEKHVRLDDFRRNKIVVVDMWATWCTPCKRSLPHLSRIADAVKGQDVEVVALNVFDDPKPYAKFSETHSEYHFQWARDPAGRKNEASIAKNLYNVSGIPATFIIGKDGKIAAAISGYSEGDERVNEALKRLGVKLP